VIPYIPPINDAQKLALAGERYHHRTNMPPYRPDPISLTIQYRRLTDEHSYGDLLAELWEEGEPFINLEHDVAPWPGALTQMWSCKFGWCAMPLIVHQCVNETNLGCVKFSKSFIEAYPDLWTTYPRNEIFDWRSLDAWLYQKTQPLGHHRHAPPALHLNEAHV
jgi:hypothetical protein